MCVVLSACCVLCVSRFVSVKICVCCDLCFVLSVVTYVICVLIFRVVCRVLYVCVPGDSNACVQNLNKYDVWCMVQCMVFCVCVPGDNLSLM